MTSLVAARHWSLVFLFGASVFLVGCGETRPTAKATNPTTGPEAEMRSAEGSKLPDLNDLASSDGASVSPSPSALLVAPASLRIVDAEQYAEQLKKLEGKVVLVDFWATWCGPCKEQFPHSNDLAKKLGERGLSVVSVSFDDPDNQDAVASFLNSHPGPMTHLLSSYGAGVESFDNFAIEGGAVPFFKLYDRTGKLRYQFCGDPEGVKGVISIEELDGKIEELLSDEVK